MASRSPLPASRYRRRILGLGVVATGVLYVVGAPIFNERIESDLEARVPAELADVGYVGISASFSGQDGTFTCVTPLDDPEGARAAAYEVHGVHSIDLDRSCRVNTSPPAGPATTVAEPDEAEASTGDEAAATTTASPSTTDPEAELATVANVVAANPDLAFFSVLLDQADLTGVAGGDVTLFAPSNDAFNDVPADLLAQLQDDAELIQRMLLHHAVAGIVASADLVEGELETLDGGMLVVETNGETTIDGATLTTPDIAASNGVVHVLDGVLMPDFTVSEQPTAAAAASFDGSAIVLTGVAASEVERQAIITAAGDAVGAGSVTDELTVDPDTGLDADTALKLATLISAMPSNLASGEVGFDGEAVYAIGVFVNEEGRDVFTATAADVDVEADLEAPPEATAEDAAALEAALNEFVSANPILFEPTSPVLTESAFEILDRIALDAQGFEGLAITVEGHTDSDGDPSVNQELSQARADAVRDALIERGVSADAVEAIGFGSDRPVLVDGAEDKEASRRVEFQVAAP